MVPKASQRANGQQLAIHLLNAHDNERVEIAHIRGAIAKDLPGAFDEWYAISRTTQCRKFLYSLSINPDPRQGPLSRRQYKDYIARVEKKLGLTNQPRAIVFHAKDGREHCHVVWSRIIPGALKAVPISHDRKSLQTITRQFAKDYGLTLPANMNPGGSPADTLRPANTSLHEKHQQERTGLTKEQRVQQITQLWNQADSGPTFVHSLAQAGYHLARGDRVPYAILDRFGEIHSLPRQIEGVKTQDVRARLTDFPPESLPAAAAVREQLRHRLTASLTPQFNNNAQSLREHLKTSQDSRRATFHTKLAALRDKHRTERTAMVAAQKEDLQHVRADRVRASATGFMALLIQLPGISTIIARRHKQHDLTILQNYRQERRALLGAQRAEFEDLKRQTRAIARVEKREWRSLKTKLLRDFCQTRITGKFQEVARDVPPTPFPHPDIMAAFAANAGDMTAPPLPSRTKTTTTRRTKSPDPHSLAAAFAPSEAAAPPALRCVFHKAARPPAKPHILPASRLDLDG